MKLRVIDPLTIAGVIYIFALWHSHWNDADKAKKIETAKSPTEIVNVVKK